MKLCLCSFLIFGLISASADIALLPEKISLAGPEARQQMLALELADGLFAGEATSVEFSSSNQEIVAISSDGVAIPKSNGKATITAKRGTNVARTAVVVSDFDEPWQWSFRHHVLPVISRSECNTGGCHGALAGKGGFRLSLFGYDPEADFRTITREMRGRRIEFSDPGRSLFLTKPTTTLKHKGGKRLTVNSQDYRILADWIANGAAQPRADDETLVSLETFPALSLLKPGDSQQLVVRANYSNGREEDVTRWARFTATDKTVADVDEHGKVSVMGHGEGAITVWFSSRLELARVSVPFPNKISTAAFEKAPKRNQIDEINLAQLQRLNLKPSPRSTDEAFIRRAYIDTIGKLPTPEETRAFLADSNWNKRDTLIHELLERPEFIDYWTYKWADILLITGQKLRPAAVEAYYKWVRSQVEAETPWDEFTRQIVTAKGSSVENGASNFFAVHQDPETMAENVSQAFMSLSIGCAKCHNHPLEKWTNDQYYAFANLFSRVKAKGWGGDARNGDGKRTLYVEPRGELIQPRTGEPQLPAPLDADPILAETTEDRRDVLATWLTSPQNPYFTKAIANRVWANFMGMGLVESVDDLRVSNPASNEELLDALADFVVENDYNLKALMRLILESETYQRSNEVLPENRDDSRFYSRYFPRRLMAEVLSDAISDITKVRDKFTETLNNDGSAAKTEFYQEGTRALQLYDSAVKNYFLSTFGRNKREITCECERSNQPSMVQVLHLSNGGTINDKLGSKDSLLANLMDLDDSALIEEAYLLCLSRGPTPAEMSGFHEIFAETPAKERKLVVEDLFWSLMTSREFLFQH